MFFSQYIALSEYFRHTALRFCFKHIALWSYLLRHCHPLSLLCSAGVAECLLDKPRKKYRRKVSRWHSPGELYNVDKQCELLFGTGSKVCPYMVSLSWYLHYHYFFDFCLPACWMKNECLGLFLLMAIINMIERRLSTEAWCHIGEVLCLIVLFWSVMIKWPC